MLVFGRRPSWPPFFFCIFAIGTKEKILIKPETIQTIIDAARIEDVVGDFVPLKKRGVNYIGLCPFHNEKTPSFVVSPSKGIFKCFGCGKSGTAVGFIMEHEHYSYPEALKYLAKKYGIEVEEEAMSDEMRQEIDERDRMFALNQFISEHFQHNLFNTEDGKAIGLSYLKERDFIDATIKKFQLGFAANAWEEYSQYALRNGYKKEELVKTGLSIEKEGRLIDRFKGRVIFPIHNLTGKVIGFGGRILTDDKKTAKYLNSPESEIYNKSKSLYGIFFAKNAIAKADSCYLVEGYTDVISMHQAGIENVVASSGTSLTTDQIKLIKRYTKNIVILYDGDPAGIKASFRGIDLILEQGMNVKIALFPEGEDPDSFVRNHRRSEVDDFLRENTTDFITFKTELLLKETKNDPVKKAELIKEIVESISKIPNGITRNVYIQECSTVMNIAEQTLMNELNKILRQRYRKRIGTQNTAPVRQETDTPRPDAQQVEADPYDSSAQEREVLRMILQYGDAQIEVPDYSASEGEVVSVLSMTVAEFVITEIEDEMGEMHNPVFQRILNLAKEKLERNEPVSEKSLLNENPPKEIQEAIIDLVSTPYELSNNWKKHNIYVKNEEDELSKAVIYAVLSLKSKRTGQQMKIIMDKLKNATDLAESKLLMMEYDHLKGLSILIQKALNRVFAF